MIEGGGAIYCAAVTLDVVAGLKHPFALIAITLIVPVPAAFTKALILLEVDVPDIKEGNVH